MIFYINTLLPALEVNGMALLQEKPMVEVAFVVVYTFLPGARERRGGLSV